MSVKGNPTTVDILSALAYARDQINKLKCNDPDIIKAACAKSQTQQCIKWKDDDSGRLWDHVCKRGDKLCSTDDDCKVGSQGLNQCLEDPRTNKKVCSYCTIGEESGHCHIVAPDTCSNSPSDGGVSLLPYTCDQNGECKSLSKDELKKGMYSEWHADPSKENGGQCVFGNFLLKQWCENPKSRCVADKDGKYPPQCKEDDNTPGVTDVPPFAYNSSTGTCSMTNSYCDRFGMDFTKSKACTTDKDCEGDTMCYKDTISNSSYCVGPESECTESTGQKIGEFFVGKTLFRMFKSDVQCDFYSNKASTSKGTINNMFRQFDNAPSMIRSPADPRDVEKKVLVGKDFAGPGINMYTIHWKPDSGITPMVQTGFLANEVKRRYPRLVKKRKGRRYIEINKNAIKGNKDIKRMYLSIFTKGWLMQNFMDAVSIGKTMKQSMKK